MFSLHKKPAQAPSSISHLDLTLSHHPILKILEWTGFGAILLILFLFWCSVMFGWPFEWSPKESPKMETIESQYTVTSTSPEPLPFELTPLYTVHSSTTAEIPDKLKSFYTVRSPQTPE